MGLGKRDTRLCQIKMGDFTSGNISIKKWIVYSSFQFLLSTFNIPDLYFISQIKLLLLGFFSVNASKSYSTGCNEKTAIKT